MSTRQTATLKIEPSLSTRLRTADFGCSHRPVLLFMLAFLLLGVSTSEAGLKIYYIRHAEGGHNVKKNWETYSGIPQDQWPDYVGNPDVFTPMGRGQLARVPGKLKRYRFDFIAASPIWRARNTILPYMTEVGAKGEVWPELAEIYNSSLVLSTDLTPPVVKILGAGPPVKIPSDEAPHFSVRKGGEHEFKRPSFPEGHTDMEGEAAAAQLIQKRVIEMIKKRFGGSDKTILLAGHGSSGKGLVRMLTQNRLSGFPSITNTGLWMVEEQPSGEFKLKMYNDVPIENLF